MSFLPDELKDKVNGAFPSISARMENVIGTTMTEDDIDGENVLIPSIKTTHELSKVLQTLTEEGFKLSFGGKSIGGVKPKEEVLLEPMVAAMFVADGFTVLAMNDKEVRVINRFPDRQENDRWGFEVVQKQKS